MITAVIDIMNNFVPDVRVRVAGTSAYAVDRAIESVIDEYEYGDDVSLVSVEGATASEVGFPEGLRGILPAYALPSREVIAIGPDTRPVASPMPWRFTPVRVVCLNTLSFAK